MSSFSHLRPSLLEVLWTCISPTWSVGVCVPWPVSHCVLQHLLSVSPFNTSLHGLGTGVPVLLAHRVSEMTSREIFFHALCLTGCPFYFSWIIFLCFLTEQRVVHIRGRRTLYKSFSTKYCCCIWKSLRGIDLKLLGTCWFLYQSILCLTLLFAKDFLKRWLKFDLFRLLFPFYNAR